MRQSLGWPPKPSGSTSPAWPRPGTRRDWGQLAGRSGRWLLLVPAVALLLYACSEAALRSVRGLAAAGDTRSTVDNADGYAPWPFSVLAPPATALAEQVQQNGIGLFDLPPGPVPGEDFVPPAPTSVESLVVVLSTPTAPARPTRPPWTIGLPSSAMTASAMPTVETGTPTEAASATLAPSGTASGPLTPTVTRTPTTASSQTGEPSRTPSRTPTRTPSATRTDMPTHTPTRTPTGTPQPTDTPPPSATPVILGSIRGRILRPGGVPLAGVTVSLSNGQVTTTSGGWYEFDQVPSGDYAVTPSKEGCIFAPASRNVSVDGDVASGTGFTGFCSDPPTATVLPPTGTPVVPTATSLPPTATDTDAPPTATPTPPPSATNTEVPTATDPPPTATDPPPTATDPPPTLTDPPPTATDPPPTATDPPPTATFALPFFTATDPPPTDPPPSATPVITPLT